MLPNLPNIREIETAIDLEYNLKGFILLDLVPENSYLPHVGWK
jgi:hypothetical protein